MAILLVRGVAKALNANFNGKIYGPIIWTAAPAGVVDLSPINGGAQVNVTAGPNAPAGGVVLTVSSLNAAQKIIGGSCTVAVEQVVTPPPPNGTDAVTPVRSADGRITGLYGKLFDGNPPGDPLPAYKMGGLSVPAGQGYYQQVTDRADCPLTVKAKPSQIIAGNRSFAFGDIGVPIISLAAIVFAGPLDNAGVEKSMNAGGSGSDRSLVTDYAAHFMLTGDPASMFAQALAADSIPINYVDANTGKLPDLIANPLTNSYGTAFRQEYKPFFPCGPLLGDADGNYKYSGGWTPVTDHFPELTYMAFQASHDLGLLFNKQAAATFAFTAEPGESGPRGVALIPCLQQRYLAWGLRDLFQAHVMTMDAEALGLDMTGLHPSSYWKTLIDNQLAYRAPIMNDPRAQTFRLIDIDHILHFAPWQYDYLLTTLAFAVLTGHAEWAPLFLWCLGNLIARTNGTSGWPPGLCTPYKINGVLGGGTDPTLPPFSWGKNNANPTLPPFNWAQAFANQVLPSDDFAPITKSQYDALIAQPDQLCSVMDGTYLFGSYSVLTMADYLDKKGLAGVRDAHPDFDTCLINIRNLVAQWKSAGKQVSERYCVLTAA